MFQFSGASYLNWNNYNSTFPGYSGNENIYYLKAAKQNNTWNKLLDTGINRTFAKICMNGELHFDLFDYLKE